MEPAQESAFSRATYCIEILKDQLIDAEGYKHTHLDKDVSRTSCTLDELLYHVNILQTTLPADDKKLMDLESEVVLLEAEVRKYQDRLRNQGVTDFILLIVLRNLGDELAEEIAGKDWRLHISNWMSDEIGELNHNFDQFLKSMQERDDMPLLRWMETLVQLLKADFDEFLHGYERLSEIGQVKDATVTRFIKQISDNIGNFTGQMQGVKVAEDDQFKHDELIFTTIVKIARAHRMLSNAFEVRHYHTLHKPELIVDPSCIGKAIDEALVGFDDVALKLPKNFDITLQSWLQNRLQPSLQGYIRAKLKEKSEFTKNGGDRVKRNWKIIR